MKKLIALLLAVMLVISLAACGGKDDNKVEDISDNAIVNAFANLSKQITENGGYFSISTEGNILSALGAESEGLSLSGLEFVIDKGQVEMGVLGTLSGNKITDTVYLSDKAIVLNAPALLGGVYGIDLTTYAKDWETSYLNPKNGSEYAIEGEMADLINQMVGIINGSTDTSAIMPGVDMEKASQTITAFFEKLMAAIEKTIPVSKKTEGKYTTESVMITLDNMDDLFNAIADAIASDKEFQANINSILTASGSEALPFDELIAMLRTATNAIDAPAGAELNVVISHRYSKDGMDNTLMFGIEIKEGEESATMAFGIQDLMTDSSTVFTHTINTDFQCTGYFEELLADDAEAANIFSTLGGFEYKTNWSKKDGKLTITVSAMDQTITLNANLKFNVTKNGGLELIFVFEKLDAGDLFTSTDILNAPITIKMSTEKPKTLTQPEFKNMMKDESIIEDIAAYMNEKFGDMFSSGEKDTVSPLA